MESKNSKTPKGKLLIIGGNEAKNPSEDNNQSSNREFQSGILSELINLQGTKEARIEIIPAASSIPEEVSKDYIEAFGKLGLTNVGIIRIDELNTADSQENIEKLKNASVVFLTGGDQVLLAKKLMNTILLKSIKEKYFKEENFIIAGTSAGAMAMSTPMIYAGNKDVQQIGGEIKITTGLEFLKDVCIDTHFVDRSRFVRMAQVVETNPGCIGIGIEEDSAIVVRNGIEAEVIGSGLITIIEGFYIREANINEFTDKKLMSVRDLKVHLLGKGQKYTIPQANPPHH